MSSSMISPTLKAVCLGAASNIIAQLITSQRKGTPSLFSISFSEVLPFAFFAFLCTPLNIIWQEFLEDQFPGTVPEKPDPQAKERSEKAQAPVQASSSALNIPNTIIKLILDQSIGASLNTLGFLAYSASLQQASYAHISNTIVKDFWPIMKAGWKLWPLVSLLNFTVVPMRQRVVVASVFGMVWGIYLSLMASA